MCVYRCWDTSGTRPVNMCECVCASLRTALHFILLAPANLLAPDGEHRVSRLYFLLDLILIDWYATVPRSLQGKNQKTAPPTSPINHLATFSSFGSQPNNCLCRIQGLVNVRPRAGRRIWEEKWINRVTRAGGKDRAMDLLPHNNLQRDSSQIWDLKSQC